MSGSKKVPADPITAARQALATILNGEGVGDPEALALDGALNARLALADAIEEAVEVHLAYKGYSRDPLKHAITNQRIAGQRLRYVQDVDAANWKRVGAYVRTRDLDAFSGDADGRPVCSDGSETDRIIKASYKRASSPR
jgi:hypothetical protein